MLSGAATEPVLIWNPVRRGFLIVCEPRPCPTCSAMHALFLIGLQDRVMHCVRCDARGVSRPSAEASGG